MEIQIRQLGNAPTKLQSDGLYRDSPESALEHSKHQPHANDCVGDVFLHAKMKTPSDTPTA